ncbi:MAG TPA: sulfotransferase domain-containing protein [Bryobacteraceae bacterium]|nr:sulfotransferase domain-containing protein [Bryobacteraceae bacterium]
MSAFYWLASYPKSGNTWLRMALRSLTTGGAPIRFEERESWIPVASAREPFDTLLELESSDLTQEEVDCLRPLFYIEQARLADQPLIRKVHDAWIRTAAGTPLFPPAVTLGAIYVVRDPRDVAVSYAHHACCSIDEAIAFLDDPNAAFASAKSYLTCQLRQTMLTWRGHAASWLDAPGIRVLTVRYEDMIADPEGTLAKVATFCRMGASAELIAAATQATRFDVLQRIEEEQGFQEKPPGMKRFFRRGQAGGWRDCLTSEQAARIVSAQGEMMRRLDYI